MTQKGNILDLQDVFRRFSFDNICRFSFGLDPGCLQLMLSISDFNKAFDLASKLSAERAMAAWPLIWKLKRALNLVLKKNLKQAIKIVDLLAEEMIKNRRKMGFSTQKDLLSRFMGTIDDDQYLRDIVISFLLAGRDMVASGLTSFFWLLAQHPEVEKAIRDESDRVMGPVGQSDGTFVRKGTRVTYHPYAMGRMEWVWSPDHLKFKPERWLQSGVFTPVSPFKYPVFQAELRVCLGKEMALVAMKNVAISLIRRFDIQVVTPSRTQAFVQSTALCERRSSGGD
ncbi:Cytochrome P450 94C1 [Camellia lanceoleosa]|uniref:Cytochrome P450 94C1 n=1 Tax=Camellia lanceoleosa TaxID=1840588 RepID=A0ACC0IEQ1_9ERIC|nr:Cytochrome P450 94C1 [Camellia lanceoleosa]